MAERVVLVSPRGFCAGVARAIGAVERALAIHGRPVYVRRAIVHNSHVVRRLADAGAVVVDEVDQVPVGSVVVLSAHGVPPSVHQLADERALRVVDATCPLVRKVHSEVRRFASRGFDVLMIGHDGHDEVRGTLGQARGVRLVERLEDVTNLRVADSNRVACVTQTTLSRQDVAPVINALRQRFPALAEPATSDICYATTNRQAAVAWLARRVQLVLVVGDTTSSNSTRLRDVAGAAGTPAYLIESVAELRDDWLKDARVVGVSAGASTPDDVVADVVDHLRRAGAVVEESTFIEECVSFRLPPEVTCLDSPAPDRSVDQSR